MLDKEQFQKPLIEFLNLEAQISQIFSTFPKDMSKEYELQKRNELITLVRVLNFLAIKEYRLGPLDCERPDFSLNIADENIGVEVLDYIPTKTDVKNIRHWNKLCEKLAADYLSKISDNPQCYGIEIKDLSITGCRYKDFKKDFQLYLSTGDHSKTKYIAKIRHHKEKQTFAYVNQGAYCLKNIDMNDLSAYIHDKKDNKIAAYQKNVESTNIWLIVKVEFDSEIDIEDAPTNYIKESPFSKIFLVKGSFVKQIWSKSY